jgi:glycosyltransferase involved in cell wall biosynthesis
MKVVHLTSVHPALDARIFHKECRTIADAGYDVVLLASGEGGEAANGVRIKLAPAAGGRLARMTRTTTWMLRQALAENADVYHFHDPELIPLGLCLKLAGRRVVYDVHEDVPTQILSKSWIAPRYRRGIATMAAGSERIGEWCFDGLVAATPGIARRFPANKTVVVQNFPLLREFDASQDVAPYLKREPVVAYVGGMTTVRGTLEMIKAITLLPARNGLRLSLAGSFQEAELEATCRAMPGWSRVEFLGWRSRIEIAALLGRARIGLVVLHPIANYLDAYPVKLFEYMAAGLPVVASDFPLWRDIVDGCGLLVDPFDAAAIARAIEWLLAHPEEAAAMGARGRTAVMTRYNWDTEGKKLLRFYRRLAA